MGKLEKFPFFAHEISTDNINRLPYRWRSGMHVSQPQPSMVHKKTRIESFFEVSSNFVPAALIIPACYPQILLSAAHGKEEVLCQSADRPFANVDCVVVRCAAILVRFWTCNSCGVESHWKIIRGVCAAENQSLQGARLHTIRTVKMLPVYRKQYNKKTMFHNNYTPLVVFKPPFFEQAYHPTACSGLFGIFRV